ncbi:TPA: DUF2207 domain-containing protein [Candidatus Saccharibacteria bacterium]|nr:DUF2207 domain-containing protein [Candidatus Saccharibacteria bacterium]HIO87478.1 DUF2207 domain-containing protein [Candidatus Saccharibacteria bacterium]
MNKYLVGLLVAALMVIGGQAVVAQNTQNFVFESFEADYFLSKDDQNVGRLDITEELVAVFPDFNQNRGIERAIPKSYKNAPVNIDITSVTDGNGQPWNYTTYTSGDFLIVRIGDANVFVHGQQTYVIEYSVDNVISFFDDHDELFWDTNGTGWSQSFGSLEARFHIPASIAESLQDRQECFSGSFGSSAADCTITRDESSAGITVTATANNLLAYENASVVLGFEKGEFFADPWIKRKALLNAAGFVGVPILALGYSYRRWKKHGRDDNKRGYTTPQYVPPAGLNVVSSEVILKEKLTTAGISAGILQLATLGYIKIIDKETKRRLRKDKHELSLELTKDPSSAPHDLQEIVSILFESVEFDPKKVLTSLFKGDLKGVRESALQATAAGSATIGEVIQLDTQKNKLYTGAQKLIKNTPTRLAKEGYFKVAPDKAKASWVGRSILMALLSVPFFFILPGVGFGFIAAGVLMLFWTNAMPARTSKGSAAFDHIKGLEEYIKLAEADRLEFHQGVEGSKYGSEQVSSNEFKLRIYEELLPYAMLFGLTESWSEQFKDLYQQPPDWYNSNARTFNSLLLADSLNNLSSSAQNAFTPPSNSGASGGSGFSGGFSGGGGGGGGGGGW